MAVLSAILTPKWLIGPPRLKPSGMTFLILLLRACSRLILEKLSSSGSQKIPCILWNANDY
jgi:hypothetical protein